MRPLHKPGTHKHYLRMAPTLTEVLQEMLYVYAVDMDASNAQTFVFRGNQFHWSVRGSHVTMTRYDPAGLYMTFWHCLEPAALVAKMNGYMQSQRWAL